MFPTRRLSTKVFLPPASPYSSPTLRLSSPTLPLVFQALPYPSSFKQAPLPTQSSFQPPLLLPTHCLSRLHVFMNSRRPNPCLSHIQDVSRRESRAEQKETNQKTLGKKSLKLVHKTSAGISRRRHLTTLPSVFQQGGDEEKMK